MLNWCDFPNTTTSQLECYFLVWDFLLVCNRNLFLFTSIKKYIILISDLWIIFFGIYIKLFIFLWYILNKFFGEVNFLNGFAPSRSTTTYWVGGPKGINVYIMEFFTWCKSLNNNLDLLQYYSSLSGLHSCILYIYDDWWMMIKQVGIRPSFLLQFLSQMIWFD